MYEDICPFTVFGSFNKGITNANRIALLEQFAKQFSIKAAVPTEFDGIPVVMNLSAWFFAYKERNILKYGRQRLKFVGIPTMITEKCSLLCKAILCLKV